jgi:hypothetical protein
MQAPPPVFRVSVLELLTKALWPVCTPPQHNSRFMEHINIPGYRYAYSIAESSAILWTTLDSIRRITFFP